MASSALEGDEGGDASRMRLSDALAASEGDEGGEDSGCRRLATRARAKQLWRALRWSKLSGAKLAVRMACVL